MGLVEAQHHAFESASGIGKRVCAVLVQAGSQGGGTRGTVRADSVFLRAVSLKLSTRIRFYLFRQKARASDFNTARIGTNATVLLHAQRRCA